MGLSTFPRYSNQSLNEIAIDLGSHKDAYLDTFFAFYVMGGHVGLPLALLTMILTKTINQRQPTLINLLICWTIYSTSNLIVYARAKNPMARLDSKFVKS